MGRGVICVYRVICVDLTNDKQWSADYTDHHGLFDTTDF